MIMRLIKIFYFFIFLQIVSFASFAAGQHNFNTEIWKTNFSNTLVDFGEIIDGGPGKDGIPAIDKPKFKPIAKIKDIGDAEPLITVNINGDVRGYPLRILIWHEIVNDVVGGVPILITYCPLCNSAIVFERTLTGDELSFGVSGFLRKSDMIMYDRQSESWWQQFTGEAIVGLRAGQQLKIIPSRVESFALLQARFPKSKILVPNQPNVRFYGKNPYVGYDTSKRPFLYTGNYQGKLPPLSYVIVVGEKAWPLAELRKRGKIKHEDIIINWTAGQNSALDSENINQGRDIGNVVVRQKGKDIPYHIVFAFVYDAFINQKPK